MNGLTGNKDVDILILQKLKDTELLNILLTNKYLNSLCNEQFIINRLISYINTSLIQTTTPGKYTYLFQVTFEMMNDMKNFLFFENWKDFYAYIIKIDNDWDSLYHTISNFLEHKNLINEGISKENQNIGKVPEWINLEKLIISVKRKLITSLYNHYSIVYVSEHHERIVEARIHEILSGIREKLFP